MLQQLLDAQTSEVRKALALAAGPIIPLEAILALSPQQPIADAVHAAAGVGLLQAGLHLSTGEQRYLISPSAPPR